MKKINFILAFLISFAIFSCKKDNNDIKSDLPSGAKISSVTNSYDLVYGGSGNNDDELASGMLADNSGNVYVSMNVTNTQANRNIIVMKVKSDGTLGWANQYDGLGRDISPDSGENGETGGTAGSISMDSDGKIYISGIAENNQTGSTVLVMKLNPDDGSIIWQKSWKPSWPADGSSPTASQNVEGYAIDASGDYVYITGVNGTNEVLAIALNKNDGSIFFQKGIDVVQGTKDRGYAIKEDASGNLFIGGIDGSYAFIAKLTNANTADPQLAWIKYPGLSYGARINNIDIDNSGVYYSCDVRGASTTFTVMKTDFDGNFKWAKTFTGSKDDRNNTHVVYVSGDYVYAGGRIGEPDMDLMGDALLIKLNKSDGSLSWAGIYYTGKDSEKADDQRIKGIAVVNDNVYIAGQIYPSDNNTEHYYGSWVENSNLDVIDFSASFSNVSTGSFKDFNGEVRDANEQSSQYSTGVLQNSTDKVTQNAPDADTFIMKFKL